MCICCPIIALRMYMAENDKIDCIRNPLSLILSYHNFVNISTVSQVRICRGTRNTRNASAKFWKTSEAEKVQTISFRLREAQLHWAKPTSFATCRNIIWGNASTSFICAASGNDVLASLEMMLPLRANDVVPAAQMKNPRTKFSDFWLGWPDLNRRMRESKSRALPLGDIPRYSVIIANFCALVKKFCARRRNSCFLNRL